jgi:hypothetical protein
VTTATEAARLKAMPCRRCTRRIFHALPIDGPQIPIVLDAEPVRDGSYALAAWGGDLCLPQCYVLDERDGDEEERFARHRCMETL